MSFLSWNCRGLGNPQTVRDLHRLVKEKRPSLVFLMETKSQSIRLEKVRVRIGFDNVFVVNSVGKSGGLALLWRNDICVEIQNYSRHHINAVVSMEKTGPPWKFSGFYGHPEADKRSESWSLLRLLGSFNPHSWLCLGDFNEILEADEKFGGNPKSRSQMKEFRDTLSCCNLHDLGFVGPKFTWNNMREGDYFIKERLDRVFANESWQEKFPFHEVQVLASRNSDHAPLALSFNKNGPVYNLKQKLFRYEARWGKNEKSKKVVRQIWREKAPAIRGWQIIKEKLDRSRKGLLRWQKVNRDPTESLISQKTEQLRSLQGLNGIPNMEEVRKIKREVNELMSQVDLKWRQRAKEHWLKLGDKNTKFFHSCVKQRRRANTIQGIIDEHGRQVSTPSEIEEAFTSYFRNIFTSSNPTDMDLCLEALPSRVSPDMNANSLGSFP
jgi:exonuclease III